MLCPSGLKIHAGVVKGGEWCWIVYWSRSEGRRGSAMSTIHTGKIGGTGWDEGQG